MTVGQGRILFIDNKWDPEKRADARVASPSPKRQLQKKKRGGTTPTTPFRFASFGVSSPPPGPTISLHSSW
jgi:hypothetical protein